MPVINIIQQDGRIQDYPIDKKEISIGRSKDCDIVLADNTASRNHAEIVQTKEGYLLKDLGSFNGTRVNGKKIQSLLLRHDDQVEIGLTKMTFFARQNERSALVSSVVLSCTDYDDKPQKVVGTSPQTAQADSNDLLVVQDSASAALNSDAASGCRESVTELERANKVLFVLYEISRQLNTIHDFNALLTKIMDLIFQVIDADYGFLILTGEDGDDDLMPVVVKYRDEHQKGREQLKASRTIINRVIKDKVALLTSDAMDDSRLDYAKSVFIQQIRSAMCVPLWKKDQIIGVIQLDSVRLDNQLTTDDLELLKAIGSQVAMIIEQASLNEQIRAEEDMRSRLERYHSPQVIEMILQGGQETKDNIMEAKELPATILFTDIIGFTSLSEKMPAREINIILNQYFSEMTDIVFKHDGTLDKYIGDGLMAVFGAPMPKDDDAVRAIKAAQEMRSALVALRKHISPQIELNIRIGINTGKVVAGNIGSPRRLEYTVIGDPVNTASRLESLAQPNQILIGDNTWQLVKDEFTINTVGERRVKGKSAEIMVYEVV